ncbi:MAG: ATPase, T2SS/T4P/T4SS family [Ruminococcus sp.]|nr:ATPase, T2SS/T4P/T4SS family [Ruminococcus sp.]
MIPIQTNRLDLAAKILPQDIKSALYSLSAARRNTLTEIRLRLGKAPAARDRAEEFSLCGADKIKVGREHIDAVILRAFRNSIHSHKREMCQGYITIEGGSRVGFCGTAALNPENNFCIENIKDISSVNIRIAHEIKGCGAEIYGKYFSQKPVSMLIAGPPSCGKTTILRDLTRLAGNSRRVSLIDERCEIAAACKGFPQNDVGVMTDVFDGYGKYDGIMTAVKVMSPEVIVCDEIGADEDFNALVYALNSGVKIIATCHCENSDELIKKPVISKLIDYGAFDIALMLGDRQNLGQVTAVKKFGRELCLN